MPTCNCSSCRRRAPQSKVIREMMIPQVALESIVHDIVPHDLAALPYEDGQLLDHEAHVLLAIARAAQPRKVLEIGTYYGHTTLNLARALPKAEIHTVDLPLDFDYSTGPELTDFHLLSRRQVGIYFHGRIESSRIKQHFADTANWDFKYTGYPPATFFFIDGSHSYFYVKNDSEKCYNLCNGHGIFVWHDCDDNWCPGVERLLDEWRALGRDVVRIEGTRLGFWDSTRM
jgi:methyltransferase family protein